jgi:hypothetical protein
MLARSMPFYGPPPQLLRGIYKSGHERRTSNDSDTSLDLAVVLGRSVLFAVVRVLRAPSFVFIVLRLEGVALDLLALDHFGGEIVVVLVH